MTLGDLYDILDVKKIRCQVSLSEHLTSRIVCDVEHEDEIMDLLGIYGDFEVLHLAADRQMVTLRLEPRREEE